MESLEALRKVGDAISVILGAVIATLFGLFVLLLGLLPFAVAGYLLEPVFEQWLGGT